MTRKEKVVANMRLASLSGVYTGLLTSSVDQAYFNRCSYVDRHEGTILVFTRDTGHHTSGWFKNPDYERCYHLSISFFDPATNDRAPFDPKRGASWAKLFFGKDANLTWLEPPYSEHGKIVDVWHYRLFCNELWCAIKPRGEVYSKDFTEKGWRSFSEIHGDKAKHFEFAMGDPG